MRRLLILGLFGFFATAPFPQQPDPNAAPPKPAEHQGPPADKAAQPAASQEVGLQVSCLRVYRQHRYAGSALAPSIYVDDKQVARVGNGRRFTARLTPRTHTIPSDDQSSALSLAPQTAQHYYPRV